MYIHVVEFEYSREQDYLDTLAILYIIVKTNETLSLSGGLYKHHYSKSIRYIYIRSYVYNNTALYFLFSIARNIYIVVDKS